VPLKDVEKTIPHLPEMLQAVARLQLLCGCRGGELLTMKPEEVDRSNPQLWQYSPSKHKTENHDIIRTIVFGPKGIEILTPWMKVTPEGHSIFSPKRSEQIRNEKRNKNRQTPQWPSHLKRNTSKRSPNRRRQPKIDTVPRVSSQSYPTSSKESRSSNLETPQATSLSRNPPPR
jgi:integrase